MRAIYLFFIYLRHSFQVRNVSNELLVRHFSSNFIFILNAIFYIHNLKPKPNFFIFII